MDRRTGKTRTAIYNAFSALLAEKRYSKITIQEIIDCANIGRSTFYSHFQTKDDLLKSMCFVLFEGFHSKTTNISNANPNSIIVAILNHIKENQKVIKGVFSSNSAEFFTSYFKGYFNEQIEHHLLISYIKADTGIPKEFLINHISGSFVEMIKWWIGNNMIQTPEELSYYFKSVIFPVISSEYGYS